MSEGGSGRTDVPGYRAVPVRCTLYAPVTEAIHPPSKCPSPVASPGNEIVAIALVATSDVLRPGTLPSDRYAKLLINGAAAYGLDKDYQTFLQSHPRHKKTCAGICTLAVYYVVVLLPLWVVLLPFWCCCGGRQRKLAKGRHPETNEVVVIRKGKPPARCFHDLFQCLGGVSWNLNALCLRCCRGRIEFPDESVRSPVDVATRWPQFKEPSWKFETTRRDEYPLPADAYRL